MKGERKVEGEKKVEGKVWKDDGGREGGREGY